MLPLPISTLYFKSNYLQLIIVLHLDRNKFQVGQNLGSNIFEIYLYHYYSNISPVFYLFIDGVAPAKTSKLTFASLDDEDDDDEVVSWKCLGSV